VTDPGSWDAVEGSERQEGIEIESESERDALMVVEDHVTFVDGISGTH
jgi:hypothetical protein